MEIFDVALSAAAKKGLKKAPTHVVDKFYGWVRAVEREGLRQVQKIPGYHDEPLRGKCRGQRSIRLNRSYRAIYVIRKGWEIAFLCVEEVTKHEY